MIHDISIIYTFALTGKIMEISEERTQLAQCSSIDPSNSKNEPNHLNQNKQDSNQYQCKFCGKEFKTNSSFTKHERIHTGEKPFECKTCKKKFTQISNLKKHEIIHK